MENCIHRIDPPKLQRVVNTLYIHTLILIISYKNHLTNRIIQNHAANVITRRIIQINSTLSSKLSIRFQKKKKKLAESHNLSPYYTLRPSSLSQIHVIARNEAIRQIINQPSSTWGGRRTVRRNSTEINRALQENSFSRSIYLHRYSKCREGTVKGRGVEKEGGKEGKRRKACALLNHLSLTKIPSKSCPRVGS